jgi:hypothetical protein
VILDVPRTAPSHPIVPAARPAGGGNYSAAKPPLAMFSICSHILMRRRTAIVTRLLVKPAVPPLLTRCFVRCYPAVFSLFCAVFGCGLGMKYDDFSKGC